MRNRLILSAVASAIALAMAASSALAQPASDITATLKIFQNVGDQKVSSTDEAIARFKLKFPNVTIEPQYVPLTTWGEYNTSFINQVATGDAPDIVFAAIEGFAETANRGLLVDLGPIFDKDSTAKAVLDELDPNLLNGMRTRSTGQLNFFPTEWNNVIMYYNKDMFDKAGLAYPTDTWTWADFREAAKKLTITDANGNVTQYGYFVPGFNFGLTPWWYTNDASVLDKDWKLPTVTSANFRESLQFLHDLIQVDKSAPAFEAGVGSDKFNALQVAMVSAGHWVVPDMIKSGLTRVGVQVMPINKVSTTVFGIGGLAITAASKNPELAWEFVKEMTGKEFQTSLADSGGSIPSWRSLATTDKYLAYPDNAQLFYASAATALPVVAPANFAEVEEMTMRYVGAYLNDNEDLETTISGLDSELSRAMERVNKK
jgi:multiple sugar transport system substrate-binding protein